jgi:maleylacetate reductase
MGCLHHLLARRVRGYRVDHADAGCPQPARAQVVETANRARAFGADLLVAVGGGSVVDATKAAQLCLWADLRRPSDMDRYHTEAGSDAIDPASITASVRMVAIPTTLSAAEFTITATLANHATGRKENFAHPRLIPRAVILDPAMTRDTPDELWFSTGIKAIDHAVEQLCNPSRAPFADAVAVEGLRWLAECLRPGDLDARLACQFGMWLSISGATAGRGRGASHAIGHSLGAVFGVPHGMTSCITLPAVLRWNEPVDRERQQFVARAMGVTFGTAADAVKDLCRRLGLPTQPARVGIARDLYRAVAEDTMRDPGVRANPRAIKGPEDIVEILALAEAE